MFIKLISEDTNFLAIDEIGRFNRHRTVFPKETVSQHSYWVVLMTHLLMVRVFGKDSAFFRSIYPLIMQKAIFGDFEETLSGDVVFDLKHNEFNGEDINREIDLYVSHTLNSGKAFTSKVVTEELIEVNLEILSHPVDGIVNSVYKLADWLACMKQELKELSVGNATFMPMLAITTKAIRELLNKLKKQMTKIELTSDFFDEIFEELFLLECKYNINQKS